MGTLKNTDPAYRKAVGRLIKEAREAQGLYRPEVAARYTALGFGAISAEGWKKWEEGAGNAVDKLKPIADVLRVSEKDLQPDDLEPQAAPPPTLREQLTDVQDRLARLERETENMAQRQAAQEQNINVLEEIARVEELGVGLRVPDARGGSTVGRDAPSRRVGRRGGQAS